jgi:hypothetical protein
MTANPRDLEIIHAACVRRGQTPKEADEVIETIVSECSKGDSGLLEFFLEHARLDIH